MTPGDETALREALERLGRVLREELAAHPSGHLGPGPVRGVPVELTVPTSELVDAGQAESARAALRDAADRLLVRRAMLRPGRVWCLRCASADCEHSLVREAREVFAGWGPSGIPRFRDLAQLLLERGHEDADLLYRDPPGFLSEVLSGRELAEDLLPAFRDADEVRVHGQVVAGWYTVPRLDAPGERTLAITLQVVSTRGSKGKRRLGLHVLGAGLADGEAEHLVRRLGTLPWSDSLRWGQGILDEVERMQRRPGVKAEVLSRRIEGALESIARRLRQKRRSRDRRTDHAEDRHRQGDRPTRDAVRDLEEAADGAVLRDELRSTWIVLGDRARAHVFSDAGKLVTSLRSTPEATQRKRERGRWTAAKPEDVERLRSAVLGER